MYSNFNSTRSDLFLQKLTSQKVQVFKRNLSPEKIVGRLAILTAKGTISFFWKREVGDL
jgi:hypothetical protein